MPITIIIVAIRPIQLCVSIAVRDDTVPICVVAIGHNNTPAMGLDCITSHGGREAGVAHVGGCGVAQQAIRGNHRLAAEVPVEVLPEYARNAVQGYGVGARVQEATEDAGEGVVCQVRGVY